MIRKQEEEDYEVSTGNVFADLGCDQPEELLAKAKLLHEVSTLIKKSGRTEHEIAKTLGINQPKVSKLVTGRLSDFSTDTLLHYLSILGCEIEIRVKKPTSILRPLRRKGKIVVVNTPIMKKVTRKKPKN